MTKEEKWIFDEKYAGNIEGYRGSDFQNDCKRLASGEPLAYIIGCIPFLNTTIYLDSKPLIPRPETEFWTEKAISKIQTSMEIQHRDLTPVPRNNEKTQTHPQVRCPTPYLRVLDLCAGSGCIGAAVLQAIPEASVTFGEIDEKHIPTIEKNILQNLSVNRKVLEDRYEVVKSDLFVNISGTFDFILTNPPYIDVKAQTIEKSVEDNEPSLALFGGVEGLEIIKRIITDARKYLKPQSELWIEHEPSQVARIQQHALNSGFMVTPHNDQHQVARYSILVLQ